MNFEEPKDANQRPPEDSWLDEVLAHYSAAEPRSGLENRILANLEAHLADRRRRWFYVFAAAAAVVLFAILATTMRTEKQTNPENLAGNKSSHGQIAPPAPTNNVVRRSGNPLADFAPKNHMLVRAKGANRSAVLQATVKQEHFPADRPLSEQERLLQMYLKQTPQQELQLIAGRQQSAAGIDIPELEVQPIEIEKNTSQ